MGESYYNRYAKPFYKEEDVLLVLDFLVSESVPTAARAKELLDMNFDRDAVMEALKRLQEEGIDYREDLVRQVNEENRDTNVSEEWTSLDID